MDLLARQSPHRTHRILTLVLNHEFIIIVRDATGAARILDYFQLNGPAELISVVCALDALKTSTCKY